MARAEAIAVQARSESRALRGGPFSTTGAGERMPFSEQPVQQNGECSKRTERKAREVPSKCEALIILKYKKKYGTH